MNDDGQAPFLLKIVSYVYLPTLEQPENLAFQLNDGRAIAMPLAWYPQLQQASDEEKCSGEILPFGEGVEWKSLDLTVTGNSVFHFFQDLEAAKKETVKTKQILQFEFVQPTSFRLPDTQKEYAEVAVAALERAEISNTRFLAASVAPLLLVLGVLRETSPEGLDIGDKIGGSAVALLFLCSVYFFIYRALLSGKRNAIEGYMLGLFGSYRLNIFPRKQWLWLNYAMTLLVFPIAYILVGLLLAQKIW